MESCRTYTKEQVAAARDAIAIDSGACNGRAISRALVRAYDAFDEGTDASNTSAPVRLILHHLAHLACLNAVDLFDVGSSAWPTYGDTLDECIRIAETGKGE